MQLRINKRIIGSIWETYHLIRTGGELKDLFRQFGDVDHVEVMEGPGGKKKGFGTIKFRNHADALVAINRLNGVKFQNGSPIC